MNLGQAKEKKKRMTKHSYAQPTQQMNETHRCKNRSCCTFLDGPYRQQQICQNKKNAAYICIFLVWMKGHFSSSLSSFRYASTVGEAALVNLGLEARDAASMVDMISQIARQKEYVTSSQRWAQVKPVSTTEQEELFFFCFLLFLFCFLFSFCLCFFVFMFSLFSCSLAGGHREFAAVRASRVGGRRGQVRRAVSLCNRQTQRRSRLHHGPQNAQRSARKQYWRENRVIVVLVVVFKFFKKKKKKKALLPIHGSETFLSAVVTSVASLNATFSGLSVPLVLMNSFATHEETQKALHTIEVPPSVKILHFMQRKFPRLHPSTLRPLPTSAASPADMWYPPGHGDVFEMIVRSGVAEQLIAQGTTYAFVSNIDNPGADLDPTIAREMIRSDAKFLFEYTARSPNDRNGGVLVHDNGRAACLELSQVPDAFLAQFSSLEYNAFNTNNMWMHLPTVVDLVKAKQLHLNASVLLRECGTSEVLQLENAISSIHGKLDPSIRVSCLAVPRKRWRVIKVLIYLFISFFFFLFIV